MNLSERTETPKEADKAKTTVNINLPDAVSRKQFKSLEKKLSHAEKHSPRILSEETEIALVKEFKQIGITEASVYLDARVDTTYSKPVATQLIKVLKDAGCSIKVEQLFRYSCPIGRHPNDLWLDAGKEVKDQVKELLEKHGLSVSTRDEPRQTGTWVGIIVSIDIGKNQRL